ncbi:glycoside hydrolase family 108 protein [Lichenicola sp.]|uniref:glycoside hydrolase family 108 protein n=1 Tax=Lichenicola sp. TaxID=2804529 RepID=UPI003B0047A4
MDFQACSVFTRMEEGGYVDDPRDTGNWTGGAVGAGVLIGSNMGVGAPALASWLKTTAIGVDTMRGLSLSIYGAIARAHFWNPMSCADMPPGIDLMLFDFGWNRGPGTSIHLLQAALGLHQDGVCGPVTVRAAHMRPTTSLLQTLADAQIGSYRSLHNFAIYGGGWLARSRRRHAASIARTVAAAPVTRTAGTSLA